MDDCNECFVMPKNKIFRTCRLIRIEKNKTNKGIIQKKQANAFNWNDEIDTAKQEML